MKPQAFIAVTADQRRSRRREDQVPAALGSLAEVTTVLAFERTAGDEIQGLLASAGSVVDVVAALSRVGDWRIGLGFGQVEWPLPASTREARGTAYLAARQAVESAPRGSELRLIAGAHPAETGTADESVSAAQQNEPRPDAALDPLVAAETVLCLLRSLWSRRTIQGWEVAAMVNEYGAHAAAAHALGISPSAVSQRVATAQLADEARARSLVIDLLVLAGLEP